MLTTSERIEARRALWGLTVANKGNGRTRLENAEEARRKVVAMPPERRMLFVCSLYRAALLGGTMARLNWATWCRAVALAPSTSSSRIEVLEAMGDAFPLRGGGMYRGPGRDFRERKTA